MDQPPEEEIVQDQRRTDPYLANRLFERPDMAVGRRFVYIEPDQRRPVVIIGFVRKAVRVNAEVQIEVSSPGTDASPILFIAVGFEPWFAGERQSYTSLVRGVSAHRKADAHWVRSSGGIFMLVDEDADIKMFWLRSEPFCGRMPWDMLLLLDGPIEALGKTLRFRMGERSVEEGKVMSVSRESEHEIAYDLRQESGAHLRVLQHRLYGWKAVVGANGVTRPGSITFHH